MPDIGWPEILIIAVVILVLFGSRKLPDAARSLGRSMRIFRTEIKGMHDDDDDQTARNATQSGEPAQLTAPPRAVPVPPADQPASTVDNPDGR